VSLYKIVNSLSGKSLIKALPKHSDPGELATDFAEFFRDKVANSRMDLDAAAASLPDVGPPDKSDECFLSNTPRAIALAVLRLFQLKLSNASFFLHHRRRAV
jgi:hypothetical protein